MGMKEFFPNVKKLEMVQDKKQTALGFRRYNPDEIIGGKKAKDQLRFSLAYWHTLCGAGNDPFGTATASRPWAGITDPMALAEAKVDAAFEIMQKLGIEFFAFHDRDVAPEGATLAETNKNLDVIVKRIDAQNGDIWVTAVLPAQTSL
jgi:xylose isomerase